MSKKVSDYMSRKVISISPETGIREAYFKMREHRFRHLPVVDSEDTLIGIVSDRELRRPDWVDESLDLAHVYILDDEMSVSDVMIRNVVVVHTYDSLRKTVKLILDHKIGAAPVLDKTGNLVGMISGDDLLRALDDMLRESGSQ
jgi:acetoin utilization protein AcuB